MQNLTSSPVVYLRRMHAGCNAILADDRMNPDSATIRFRTSALIDRFPAGWCLVSISAATADIHLGGLPRFEFEANSCVDYGTFIASSKLIVSLATFPGAIAIGSGFGGALLYIPSDEPVGGGPDAPSQLPVGS